MIRDLFLAILLISGFCFAEDPARGRLPDGRAFRTDAQGIKLVDYIAELELSIEELNRKVHGLEDEVDEKNALIQSRGIKAPAPVKERDILAEKNGVRGVSSKGELSYSDCLRVSCPAPAPCAVCPEVPVQDDTELNNVRAEVNTVKSSLQEKENYILTLESRLSAAEQSSNISESTQIELQDLRTSLRTKEQLIIDKDSVIESMRQDIQGLQVKLGDVEREKESLATRAAYQPVVAAREDSYARVASAKPSRAIGSIKAELRSEFNRVRSAISSRNIKIKQYQRIPNKSVQVRNTEIRSERGLSLEAVRKRLAGTNSVQELASIRQDLRQIRSKAQKDLSMVTRLINSSKNG